MIGIFELLILSEITTMLALCLVVAVAFSSLIYQYDVTPILSMMTKRKRHLKMRGCVVVMFWREVDETVYLPS